MRLNVQTDYAMRLLMHLSVNEAALPTIAEIAARFDISRNHLMKVAHTLARGGFIEAVRGRGGGLRLARGPEKIGVGQVVRLMEGDFSIVECLKIDGGECLITPSCRLKGVFREATEAFLATLDRYTIKDLTQRNTRLRGLLSVVAA
ncbi:MAG: Rrf2 family transcriptional regulator [Parvularculaceae bacterium]|nr:Rrf2 family transcriptional regulator [Parvularculaceae bacterium]